jgi:plasmid maintenance system antidote protein VapI
MDTRPTGLALQMERRTERPKIQAKAVAHAMGISQSRLSRIENDTAPVTERMARRYREALETCRTFQDEAA